jgi:methylamine dehydrogenase heavy chain
VTKTCRRRSRTLVAALAAIAVTCASGRAARAQDDVAEPVGQVVQLPAKPGPHWFWLSDVLLHRSALYDGDTGQMLGTITAGSPGVGFTIWPLFPPDHAHVYIPESYFSRGVRGERTDVVTIYDARTLMPQDEIVIPPKRAEYFPGVQPNAISDDGRFVAVFNATPAQSLSIVDMQEKKLAGELQAPGCSLAYAAGPRRFFMLCADGAALVVTLDDQGAQQSAVRTAKFFDADKDPVFESAGRRGSEWLFVSFEGNLHAVDFGTEPAKIGEPWSLLSAEDRKAGWRVGGGQPVALHAASNRLYLLVHEGGPDTHKQAGSEIWAYDLAQRTRLWRIGVSNPMAGFLRGQMRLGREGVRDRAVSWLLDTALPNTGAESILVTQDASPVLVVMSLIPPAVTIHDATTGAVLREVAEPGLSGSVLVAP